MEPSHGRATAARDGAGAIEALARLCASAAEAPTESDALGVGRAVIEAALGGTVVLDLRDPTSISGSRLGNSEDDCFVAPLRAGSGAFGEMRATHAHLDPDPAAFLEVAGWILGAAIVEHRRRTDRHTATLTDAQAHELLAAAATIGVAASALRTHWEGLDDRQRDQLLGDLEAGVADLRRTIHAVTADSDPTAR